MDPSFRTLPMPVELRNGQICQLRAVEESDAEEICRILPVAHAQSDFLNWMPGEFNLTLEQEREYLRKRIDDPRHIIIKATHDGAIVGLAGVEGREMRRATHQGEVGITVWRAFWGQGLGRAMMIVLLDWARHRGLRKLTLRVMADNERAIRLYESLGFAVEGRLVADMLRADGSYSDTLAMSRFMGPQAQV